MTADENAITIFIVMIMIFIITMIIIIIMIIITMIITIFITTTIFIMKGITIIITITITIIISITIITIIIIIAIIINNNNNSWIYSNLRSYVFTYIQDLNLYSPHVARPKSEGWNECGIYNTTIDNRVIDWRWTIRAFLTQLTFNGNTRSLTLHL